MAVETFNDDIQCNLPISWGLGGHEIKPAKYQRYSLFRGVPPRAISRQQRNALEILKYFFSRPKINRFSKFKVLPDLKNAVLLIAMVFEALSAILTAVRHENDRVASKFQHFKTVLDPQINPMTTKQVALQVVDS